MAYYRPQNYSFFLKLPNLTSIFYDFLSFRFPSPKITFVASLIQQNAKEYEQRKQQRDFSCAAIWAHRTGTVLLSASDTACSMAETSAVDRAEPCVEAGVACWLRRKGTEGLHAQAGGPHRGAVGGAVNDTPKRCERFAESLQAKRRNVANDSAFRYLLTFEGAL